MDAVYQALIAAIFSFVFISTLFTFFLLICRSRPPPKPYSHLQTLTLTSPSPPPLPHPPSFGDISSFDPSLDHISMAELAVATKNFSADAIVGDGGFGFVYKAQLSNGVTVAVKKLSDDAFHGFREFRAEMETLGRIRHPNLAKMLGFCISGSDRILIYEFLDLGSLDQWIHDPDTNPLAWQTRIRILHGVAKGLAFLHDECRPCIIHRDIKASNVLLDADLEARIADFGLARRVGSEMTHVSTQVAGTVGYMPPEYMGGLTVATVKGDVYSFGVLMFEVASGRRPSWPITGEDRKEMPMVRWARVLVESGRGAEVLDPLMGNEAWRDEELKGFFDVAYKCTEESAKKRPSMREVVSMLEHLEEKQQTANTKHQI